MKSDKILYANSYPIRTTSPLEAFSTQAAMPSLEINTLVTDVNSFKEQFFKTFVEIGCSLLLDTASLIQKALKVLELKEIDPSSLLEDYQALEDYKNEIQRLNSDPFLEAFTRLRSISSRFDEIVSSIKKVSIDRITRAKLSKLFEEISMNKEVFTKLYETHESFEMELPDLLEGQSFNGRFRDVFVEVITNKRVGLILQSMSEAHNIIVKLQNSIDPNNLFRKELDDYQEHMKVQENLIRASARNQSTLHLESLLDEEYEQLKKFQQEISSPKTRVLYDKQLYTDFIKVLSDNILHNQEEFLRIQKPFNVYREMYGFIIDSSSFSKQFNKNLLSKAGDSLFDSMIEAGNLVEKIIELNLGDPSVNKTMLEWTNEYVDYNDFKKKTANASSAEVFSLLKGLQTRVELTQSYITETFENPLNTNTELQKLLGPFDEKIAAALKEIKLCEVLGKYSGILSPKNLLITRDSLITSGSFYENFLRVLYKKQMDLIIENLGKAKETLIQLVKLKGSIESLHRIDSLIRECKDKVKEEGKKSRAFEHFDAFQERLDKIKEALSFEFAPLNITQETQLRPVIENIDALRDLHESIKDVLEQIPDHEITEDTFTGIDWLEKLPFGGD